MMSAIATRLNDLHIVRAAELPNPISFCYGRIVGIVNGDLPALFEVFDNKSLHLLLHLVAQGIRLGRPLARQKIVFGQFGLVS